MLRKSLTTLGQVSQRAVSMSAPTVALPTPSASYQRSPHFGQVLRLDAAQASGYGGFKKADSTNNLLDQFFSSFPEGQEHISDYNELIQVDSDYDQVKAAALHLDGVAHQTPVFTSTHLNEELQCQAFLKCENFQKSGSFKFRGAYNIFAN